MTAHSAALHPADPAAMPSWARSWTGWAREYGSPIDTGLWRARNAIALAEQVDTASLKRLGISFDVGGDDHLGFNRTGGMLAVALARAGVPHEFAVRPGGHGDAYYRTALPRSLDFHAACVRRGMPAP